MIIFKKCCRNSHRKRREQKRHQGQTIYYLGTRHFIATQGQHVPTATIYQDNKSTILLAANGKISSSKRTRHINIWYFFVTNKKGEFEGRILFHNK